MNKAKTELSDLIAEERFLTAAYQSDTFFYSEHGIKPEYFLDPIHQKTFGLISDGYNSGSINLLHLLKQANETVHHTGEREKVTSFILSLDTLSDSIPADRWPEICERIKTNYKNSIARKGLYEVQQRLAMGIDASGEVEKLNDRLNTLSGEGDSLKPMGNLVDDIFNDVRETKEIRDNLAPGQTPPIPGLIPCPWPEVDQAIGGLFLETETILLAANQKQGKTTVARIMGNHAAKEGHPVAFFSLEMNEKKFTKLVSCIGLFDHKRLTMGDLSDYELQQYRGRLNEMKSQKIYIDSESDNLNQILPSVKRWLRSLPEGHKAPLIFIDYIQLVNPDGMTKSEYDAVTKVSRVIRLFNRKHNICIVNLAQLSRESEKRPNKRPVPGDLRSSGQLEQDCVKLITLYRDYTYNKDESCYHPQCMEFDVVLNRNGEPKKCMMRFDPSLQTLDYWPSSERDQYFSGDFKLSWKASQEAKQGMTPFMAFG